MQLKLIMKLSLLLVAIFSSVEVTSEESNICISPNRNSSPVVLFVNGINNKKVEAHASMLALKNKITESGICNDCDIEYFYNKTDGFFNDVGELVFTSKQEKKSADKSLVNLIYLLMHDFLVEKDRLEKNQFNYNKSFKDKDDAVWKELSLMQEILNDEVSSSFNNDNIKIPFHKSGKKVTEWLITYLKTKLQIPSVYNSVFLYTMKDGANEYNDIFKDRYFETLSLVYLSEKEIYKDRTDANYAISETVDDLVLKLEGYLRLGRKIVVVAHSQGNHIIELAYSVLQRKGGADTMDSIQVVGVASVASVTPNNTYLTWDKDYTVLVSHDLNSLSHPLKGNFHTTSLDNQTNLNILTTNLPLEVIKGTLKKYRIGPNHSFNNVYLNTHLKGRYYPESNGNTGGITEYLANNTTEYSIDSWIMGLIKGSIDSAKTNTNTAEAQFIYSSGEEINIDPKSFKFNASLLRNNEDAIVNYQWDWGDGSENLITSDPISTHYFSDFGNYRIKLTISTECGFTYTSEQQVFINFPTPVNIQYQRNGDSVLFTWDNVEGADKYDFYLSETLFDGSVQLSNDMTHYSVTEAGITLPALDKNKIYYVEVVARQGEVHSKSSDILKVELQNAINVTLSIPSTLTLVEGKTKFVPFTLTGENNKVTEVTCDTSSTLSEIGGELGSASLMGITFKTPIFDMMLSPHQFTLQCEALSENGYVLTTSNILTVTVTQTVVINNPPIASINGNPAIPRLQITVDEGEIVSLDATSSSDPDSNTLTYKWLVVGTGTVLNETISFSKIFDVGIHVVTLQVNDGKVTSEAKVRIEVKEKPNTLPVARITSDTDLTNVFEGDSVILKGNTSTDAEGVIKSYLWEELGQNIGTDSTVSLLNLTLGKHFIKLTVTDSQDATHSHQITIDAKEKLPTSLTNIPLDLEHFNKASCGSHLIESNQITLSGVDYRQGNGITSISSFDFKGSDTYVKWKAGSNTNYAGYNIYIAGLPNEGNKTTNHSFGGSTLLSNNTWYYTHYKMRDDGSYFINTAKNDYDDNGGIIIKSKEWILTEDESKFINNTTISVRLNDNYASTQATLIVAEIKTTATEISKSTSIFASYDFDQSTNIPSIFTLNGTWDISSGTSFDGSNTLHSLSTVESLASLDTSGLSRITFKYKTNISTEYKAFNTKLDNTWTTVNSNGIEGCWLNADIPINNQTVDTFSFQLTNSYYSNDNAEVYIDDVILYSDGSPTETITHNGYNYKAVTSPHTGKIWLDRNLGADRACQTFNDNQCYGDYYQWGRKTDGHEKQESGATSIQATDLDNSGNEFITSSVSFDFDWAYSIDSDGTLREGKWSETNGAIICPSGFNVPTTEELRNEWENFDMLSRSSDTAYNSFLKLAGAGRRIDQNFSYSGKGVTGYLWTRTVTTFAQFYSDYLFFGDSSSSISNGDFRTNSRYKGYSIRCIKNN